MDSPHSAGPATVAAPARWYLPAPAPYSGADRCGPCGGAGITGTRYVLAESAPMVVDEVCPRCRGCGSTGHALCRREQHHDWDPDPDDLDGSEEAAGGVCAACHGRGWFSVAGFAGNAPVMFLRMPCGCAHTQMVRVPADG